MNLDWLAEEVLRRLQNGLPRVLLLGELPIKNSRCIYVQESPYEQIVIGILTPEELLRMPSEPVCQALLNGMPVWIWPQPYGTGRHGILLRKALMEAEERLIRFGARPIRKEDGHGRRNSDRKFLGNEKM